jgi:ribosomal protein L33
LYIYSSTTTIYNSSNSSTDSSERFSRRPRLVFIKLQCTACNVHRHTHDKKNTRGKKQKENSYWPLQSLHVLHWIITCRRTACTGPRQLLTHIQHGLQLRPSITDSAATATDTINDATRTHQSLHTGTMLKNSLRQSHVHSPFTSVSLKRYTASD